MTGSEFKQIRLNMGNTQAEMAYRLGVDIQTVQRWEKSPQLAQLARLAVEKLVMDKAMRA